MLRFGEEFESMSDSIGGKAIITIVIIKNSDGLGYVEIGTNKGESVEVSIEDFEKIQKLFNTFQDAYDLIQSRDSMK